MSDLAAASLAIGLLVLVGAPALYWVFFRMDQRPDPPQHESPDDSKPLSASDVARIEQQLGVALPADLRDFLVRERDDLDPNTVSVMNDADSIIEMSRDYQAGYEGLLPWPTEWVYLGDENDACPYYVDCKTGEFIQLHKGNRKEKPLHAYRTFADYLWGHRKEALYYAELDKKPLTWKDKVPCCLPAAIVLFGLFVILPLFGFALTSLFRWLFR